MDERRRHTFRRIADVVLVTLLVAGAVHGVRLTNRSLRVEQHLREEIELRARAERLCDEAETRWDESRRRAESASRERALAETDADATRHAAVEDRVLADLATTAFADLDPTLTRTRDITVARVMLDAATRRFDEGPRLASTLEASVRVRFAAAYTAIHLLEPAAEQLGLALALLGDSASGIRSAEGAGVLSAATDACSTLALRLVESGEHDAAARWQTRALNLCRTHHGEADTRTRRVRLALIDTLCGLGRYDDAERLLRIAYDVNREALSDEHPETVDVVHRLGRLLAESRRPQAAERAMRHALAIAREQAFSPAVVDEYARTLGRFLDVNGPAVEAEPLLRNAVNAARRSFDADDLRLGSELTTLGRNLLRQRKFVEAEPVLRECLTRRRSVLDERHWLVADARSTLGEALCGQRRFLEAETLLLSGWEGLAEAPTGMLEPRQETLRRLVELYETWDRPEETKRWSVAQRELGVDARR